MTTEPLASTLKHRDTLQARLIPSLLTARLLFLLKAAPMQKKKTDCTSGQGR